MCVYIHTYMEETKGVSSEREKLNRKVHMDSAPLHTSSVYVHGLLVTFNRYYTIIHSLAICIFLYYRATSLFQNAPVHVIPWLLATTSELLLSLIWMLLQPYHWRPIKRQVFPERLPPDDQLPRLDVFVFTADPDKEPTAGVVNTVLSAMALDYPPEKLHVYLSDDGGADVTMVGLQEAWKFARDWWLPFCRKFRVKTRSPEIYFYGDDEEEEYYGNSSISDEFMDQREKIKEAYEGVKKRIKTARDATTRNSKDHPPIVKVIKETNSDEEDEAEHVQMPLLVYISREKRPSHPHHFKAGAINVLLRVSGILSNSPYILMLDCDMSCNDPTSARQAMCFHLDPTISPTLSFVQFPQSFRGISRNDIYDAEIRWAFKICWYGMDGITGPVLSGSNFYIKRVSLYGSSKKNGKEELYDSFGDSSELIGSMLQHYNHSGKLDIEENSSKILTEAHRLASCAYEEHTKWGEEVGFRYFSVVEDFFTSFTSLHCNGWKSVYLDPTRPAFMGNPTTTLNDTLVQGIRWTSGLVEVALSRFSPLFYGPRRRATLLASICYEALALFPLAYCLSLWVFATLPQLCLLHGIPLYPKVSDPFFLVASFIFVSALSKHILDILITGGSLQNVINEQRIWLIKAVTSQTYGTLDVVMKKLHLREASFLPTNKVDDDEQLRRYQQGVFDFQTSAMFLVPLVGLVFLNVLSFSVGLARAVVRYDVWEKMLVQVFLSFYVLVLGYPIIEGVFLRKDKGRIQPMVALISAALTLVFLVLGSIALSLY